MSNVPWQTAPPLHPDKADRGDNALADQVAQLLLSIYRTDQRGMQVAVGASEIGSTCERRLAYRYRGTPKVNRPDPWRAMVGTAVHLYLSHSIAVLSAIEVVDRFLIEHPVEYRGVPGTVDLYDRTDKVVIDWKTSSKARIAAMRRDGGPPEYYRTQVQLYGAGLLAAGFPVDRVSLVFLPLDGRLDDIWVHTEPVDLTCADTAVDRAGRIEGSSPADVACQPSRLCGWCSYYDPASTDLSAACPGRKGS